MAGNIAEFNAPQGDGINTDKAGQAASELSSSAYREGQLYKQAGEDYTRAGATLGDAVTNHEYMSEISAGAPALAAITNNQLDNWRKTVTAPGATNDPDLQKNYLANTLEPALDQWQQGFSTDAGQKWAQSQVDQTRKSFYEHTSADFMNATGEQRMQDLKTDADQRGAIVNKDPAQADAMIQGIKDHGEALKAGLSVEKADAIDKMTADRVDEVAKLQVMSYANQGNFAAAKAALAAQGADGHIAPEWQTQLVGYIKEQQKAQQADQDHAYLQQKRQQDAKDESFSNNIISQVQVDPKTGVLSVPPNLNATILATQGVSAKAKLETMKAVGAIIKDVHSDDPKTVNDLYSGLAPGSPNPTTQTVLLQQLGAQKITAQTYDQLNSIVKGTDSGKINADGFTASLAAVKQMTSGEGVIPNMKDPKGEEQYAKALPAVSAAYQAGMAKGIPENELLDPSNKNWIGNAAKPFVRDQSTWYTDIAAANLSTEPTKPAAPIPPIDKRIAGKTTYTNAAGITGTWNGTGWEIKK